MSHTAPADGTSAADIWGIGVVADHSLVLALDRALCAGRQSGSRHDSEGPPLAPPVAPWLEGLARSAGLPNTV